MGLEIQHRNVGMLMQSYIEHGCTMACCLQLTEQFSIPGSHESFIGDAWFRSTKAVAQASAKGCVSILQVKHNKAQYPKEYIEEILKDMPGGSTLY